MWSHDYFEKTLRRNGFLLIAGVDEVGRGALAGPVFAAAVVLDGTGDYSSIRDSKVLSARKRRSLAKRIHAEALGIGFGQVSESEIDRINILQATHKAMRQAVANLPLSPDMVLVDGFLLPGLEMPCIGIIDGDSRSYSIAAASIVAKVKRDALMTSLASEFPQYGFDRNMGYGTEMHRRALTCHGPSPCHRRTFQGVLAMGGMNGQ
jgi:ribonuclease HII